MKHVPLPLLGGLLALVMTFTLPAATAVAQSADASADGTGSITGRVFNLVTDRYLNNARVSVPGTAIVTFTNEIGVYRLSRVPAGPAEVLVTYTGMDPVSATVPVTAGETAQRNFELGRSRLEDEQAVKLNPFEVLAERQMSAREIAVNEQRYGSNIKQVVSADEFGLVSQDNAGELLKFLPGITIDQIGSEPSTVSVRGLPPDSTPITIDGNAVASAVNSQKVGGEQMDGRAVGLENISINNLSRIEITKSPTPDMRADSIGGTINFVSRSAFERAKPIFNYRAYFNWNTEDGLFEKSSRGPHPDARNHTFPSGSFSYIKPVSDTFGFTLSGSHVGSFEPQIRSNAQRLPGVAGTPWTTFENPFLRSIVLITVPKTTHRSSIGTTADWKIGDYNTLSVSASYNYFDSMLVQSQYNANVFGTSGAGGPEDWGPDFTQSRPGRAAVTAFVNASRQYIDTINLSTNFRHDGPVWRLESGAYFSQANQKRRDIDEGFFRTSFMQLRNLTMRLEDFAPETGMPRNVITTTADGTPIDYTRMEHYNVGAATGPQQRESLDASSQQGTSSDTKRGAHANLARDFDLPFLAAPMTVEIGADIRTMERDVRDVWQGWTFVGPDGLRHSADDLAVNYDLVNQAFVDSYTPPFGTARFESASTHKYFQLFQDHPDYFRFNPIDSLRRTTLASKWLTETIYAGYLRTDFRFFRDRLRVVAGVRYEGSENEGQGMLDDISNTFFKDAGGNPILDENGKAVKKPGTPAELAALQYTDRGARADSSRGDFFPSLNASYEIFPSLIARFAYARTISRPNLPNIIPGVTLPEPDALNPVIRVNNPSLKPWFADNYDVALEYYFGRNDSSVISVGGYHKEITDFFGVTRFPATQAEIDEFGLDPTFIGTDIQFLTNVDEARIRGIELSYRQALTFLPDWARGFEVFYNLTRQEVEGSNLADFRNFAKSTDNYGITFSRPKFLIRVKVNERGIIRQTEATRLNSAPNSFRWSAPFKRIDLEFEYRLRPNLSLFAGGRNVTKEFSNQILIFGDGTPEHGKPFQSWASGANWEFGVKGRF